MFNIVLYISICYNIFRIFTSLFVYNIGWTTMGGPTNFKPFVFCRFCYSLSGYLIQLLYVVLDLYRDGFDKRNLTIYNYFGYFYSFDKKFIINYCYFRYFNCFDKNNLTIYCYFCYFMFLTRITLLFIVILVILIVWMRKYY